MKNNWAADNLQVIRSLMERAALYRRALRPMMLLSGALGVTAGAAGWFLKLESGCPFLLLWLGTAAVAFAGSLLVVRRQALQANEPFWSAPARRVAQSVAPAFFIGLVSAVFALLADHHGDAAGTEFILPPFWMILFGLALHAAGFFVRRGIRLLGWLFILAGMGVILAYMTLPDMPPDGAGHLLMGGAFGLLPLGYGLYLHLTGEPPAQP